MSNQIKVTQCSNSILWYDKYIGMTFNVLREDEKSYWVLQPDQEWRLINWIYKSDTERVTLD